MNKIVKNKTNDFSMQKKITAWCVKNCANGKLILETLDRKKKESLLAHKRYLNGGKCVECQIVKVKLVEIKEKK